MKVHPILFIMLILASIRVSAQSPAGTTSESTEYQTFIYTSNTLSDEIRRENDRLLSLYGMEGEATRGFGSDLLSATLNAGKSMASGYITSVVDLGVNAIASLATRNSRLKKEWEETVEKENSWSMALGTVDEIKDFEPELVINAVTVKYTLEAFRQVLPVLPKDCIISDIASVKTGLKRFYEESGFRYVSTHPMFGPTFASLSNLSHENAIIITEGDHLGRVFFKDLYQTLKLNIFEYTFEEHDETVAYSLSIPFVSTFVFAAVMKHQDAPGTTFKKHMAIARGLLSEDDYLLQEILFNPRTPAQVENIRLELKD